MDPSLYRPAQPERLSQGVLAEFAGLELRRSTLKAQVEANGTPSTLEFADLGTGGVFTAPQQGTYMVGASIRLWEADGAMKAPPKSATLTLDLADPKDVIIDQRITLTPPTVQTDMKQVLNGVVFVDLGKGETLSFNVKAVPHEPTRSIIVETDPVGSYAFVQRVYVGPGFSAD